MCVCKETSADDNTRRMFVFPMGKDYQRLYLERRYLRSKCMYIGYEKIMGITKLYTPEVHTQAHYVPITLILCPPYFPEGTYIYITGNTNVSVIV